MIEKAKEFLKNKNNLIVIVLAGIFLMVIALPVESPKSASKKVPASRQAEEGSDSGSLETGGSSALGEIGETSDYITDMEAKVEALLEKMEGAGKVKVIITTRSSMEKIVEKDEPVVRSNTTEEDSEGGMRTVNSVDAGESTVYSSEGSSSEPYVVKTISPEIEGVVVLAEGAGKGEVSRNISEAIQVLFGIEAHRIKVIKMDSTN